MWIMAAGTPKEHLHVHFPDALYKALMSQPPLQTGPAK